MADVMTREIRCTCGQLMTIHIRSDAATPFEFIGVTLGGRCAHVREIRASLGDLHRAYWETDSPKKLLSVSDDHG